MKDYWLAVMFVGLTVLCWGSYGPVLHKGQAAMQNSRLRPFLFVGVAYFVIAVVVPVTMLQTGSEATAGFTSRGVVWSSMAGVAGAVGALGIIMAFNFGGKPSYVMPLVFGCAPVVNAFLTIYWAGCRLSDSRGLHDLPGDLSGSETRSAGLSNRRTPGREPGLSGGAGSS